MKMRKLLAGIAAAATLLGCAALGTASASADGTETITIVNAQQGHTYKAYKVADFTNVQTDGDTITSMDVDTVAGDNLLTVLKKAITDSTHQNIPTEYQNNPMAFVATFSADTAREFADYFQEGTSGLPNASDTVSASEAGAPDSAILRVPQGWYLVTDSKDGTPFKTALVASTVGSKTKFKTVQTKEQAALNGTLGSFYVKNENAPLSPEKHVYADDSYTKLETDKSVNIGDTLHYQVRTSVPLAAKDRTDYTITFTDKASKGLKIDESSITVCHKDKSADDNVQCIPVDKSNVAPSFEGGASTGTTTTVVVSNVYEYVGHYVFLRYTATVTADVLGANGAGRVLHNEATVKHADGAESEPGEDTRYVGDLKFYKYGVENRGEVTLSGVKFNVHRGIAATASEEDNLKFSLVDPNVAGVYKYDPVNGSATVATGENGVLQLKGLEEGDYTFVETEPAEGYAKNFMPTFSVNMDITPNSSSAIAAPLIENPLTSHNNGWGLASNWTDSSDNSTRVKVKNVKSAAQLPLTGGAGLILFSAIAVLLVAAAAVITVKIRSVRRELQA